jgi:ATP-dependent helicase HrpB
VDGAALPVDAVVPELLAALTGPGVAVLRAPPGSGKTTRVPLVVAAAPGVAGRVVVLEPRRVAARAAARRMAATLGEPVGGRVGYRIRQERVVGPATRIEVVTEGILTRMLQADPSLPGVDAVVFDEFHERSIAGDLGLALALDARAALRPDLRILVMSATLDVGSLGAVLGPDVPVVTASVDPWPVATVWLGRPPGRVEEAVARAVGRALRDQDGDVLAFLPGVGEIRRVERILADTVAADGPVRVVPLHGGLAGTAQDEALRPAGPGRRKVVLATSIAETSLTIDGVRAVVDSGLMRVARFDPGAGMSRLVTVPVSRSSADQRQGRAARQGPGVCYRLWAEAEHAGLPRTTPPEILVADLAPLALDLAEWGVDDPGQLAWVDAPPAAGMAVARAVLADIGAVDAHGRITPHGRALAPLGVHPRIGQLLLAAAGGGRGDVRLAAEVAAVLSDGDPLRGDGPGRDADLTSRVVAVRQGRAPRHADTAARWRHLVEPGRPAASAGERSAGRAERGAGRAERGAGRASRPADGVGGAGVVVPEDVGRLVAVGFPDRVGRRRAGRPGHWLLRNGRGAWVPDTDPLAAAEWIVAADVDGDRRDARIWLGAPIAAADVDTLFGPETTVELRTSWDDRRSDVVAVRETRLGAIVVTSEPRPATDAALATDALLDGIRESGLGLLPWTAETGRLRARVAFARRTDGPTWPDLGDEALLAGLGDWLAPWLAGRTRRADLASVALTDALWALIGPGRRAELEAVAPTHVVVATGERRRLDYPAEGPPVLVVRLQELFGTVATPAVAGGRVPVLLHLTSPAGRPVQVTADLASFWANVYPRVRGELRARYPRHAWPDDPVKAVPTSRPVPRRR